MPSRQLEGFIARWSAASPSERANAQLFLVELCDLLEVPRPDPKPDSGYAETLRETYPAVPDSADFVRYWWHKAAELVRAGKAERFGFITTKPLTQPFNRRVVQAHLSGNPPLSLLAVIPNHPWVDTAEGADVRIAMTVGAAGEHPGILLEVTQRPSVREIQVL